MTLSRYAAFTLIATGVAVVAATGTASASAGNASAVPQAIEVRAEHVKPEDMGAAALMGAGIGAAIGGGVGAVTGGVMGLPFMIVGAIPGAAIGGLAGAGIGAALGAASGANAYYQDAMCYPYGAYKIGNSYYCL